MCWSPSSANSVAFFLVPLFLLVFFDSQARVSLLGEVDRALLVNNLRRRGVRLRRGVLLLYTFASSYILGKKLSDI